MAPRCHSREGQVLALRGTPPGVPLFSVEVNMDEHIPVEILYAIMVAAMYDDSCEYVDPEPVWYDEFDDK